jgi:hypothetical protein
MDTENTLLNAVLGAVATTLLTFTGISPLLGGALAGYLDGGATNDGLRIGAISGAIASIPIVGFLLLGLVLLPFLGLFGFPLEAGVAVGGVVLFGAVIVIGGVAYTVVLSALGGALGVYLNSEL